MKRWWRLLFPPRPSAVLGKIDHAQTRQTSVGLSTHAHMDLLPNVRVELQGAALTTLAFGRQGDEGRWDVWEGKDWAAGRSIPAQAKAFAPLWLFTHLSVKEAFEPLKACALTPVSGQTATTLQNESRALQWLQTSFKVLDGALARCRSGGDALVVGSLWLGEKDGRVTLRLTCFNLDLSAVFRDGGGLHVLVFDDKNHGAGSATTPSLEAEFATLKPAVLDELIKLSAAMLGAAEARYR